MNNQLGEITLYSFLHIIWLEVPLDVDDPYIEQSQEEDPAPETSATPNYRLEKGWAS